MKYKKINPANSDIIETYHLMISGIAPRPIALVGSLSKDEHVNLAPFSFFNGFGANPPIVGFSPALSGRTGLPKDTLLNVKETKEFTISIVTPDIVNQVSLSSCEFPRDVDEFSKSGLTKHQSTLIKPPGVKESPFIMECKLYNIIELGGKPSSGNLILGKIIMFHVSENILDENGRIEPKKINQVGRSGGPWYVETKKSLFKLNKPKGLGIGFDNLPNELVNSNLTGSNLAKLANVDKIPNIKQNHNKACKDINDLLQNITLLLDKDKIEDAWQLFLNWKSNND